MTSFLPPSAIFKLTMIKHGEETKMKKTSIGFLAVIALWIGVGSLAYGCVISSERVGLEYPTWTEDEDATAKDGRKASQVGVANPGQWRGMGMDLVKRPWTAAFKVVSLNLSLSAINRYVFKYSWANISLRTIQKNFETGPVWDNDYFMMNCIAHPFHGSMYFNFARSSGLSFWESVPLALGGSSMWEAFMEKDPPSFNDLIFTTVGGTYLGETLFRISSRILDNRARGLERAGRELLSFVLNPAGGLTRLLSGQMFRYQNSPDQTSEPFETTFVIGRTKAATPWGILQSGGDPFLSITFRAGDPFTGEADPRSFYFFVHRCRFQFGKKLGTTQSGYGYLAGGRFGAEDGTGHILGLFLHFDFRVTEAVRLAGPSLTGGWVSRFHLGAKAELQTAVHLGAMLLGTCNNPYVRKAGWMERDYDFGSGPVAKGEAKLSLGKWGTFELNAAHHLLAVFKGSSGADRATFLEASYDIPVYKSWSVGLEYVNVRRDSNYRDVPDVRTNTSDFRLIGAVGF